MKMVPYYVIAFCCFMWANQITTSGYAQSEQSLTKSEVLHNLRNT